MNGKKKILLISLLTAGAAVGLGCPAALSWVQDFQIERQSELLDGDTIRLTMKSSLSTAQRLWLVNYYSSSVQLLWKAARLICGWRRTRPQALW